MAKDKEKETDIPDLPTEITPQSQDFGRWYIDVVRRAIQQGGLDADQRVAGQDAVLHRVLDAVVHARDVLPRDPATGDLVDELDNGLFGLAVIPRG